MVHGSWCGGQGVPGHGPAYRDGRVAAADPIRAAQRLRGAAREQPAGRQRDDVRQAQTGRRRVTSAISAQPGGRTVVARISATGRAYSVARGGNAAWGVRSRLPPHGCPAGKHAAGCRRPGASDRLREYRHAPIDPRGGPAARGIDPNRPRRRPRARLPTDADREPAAEPARRGCRFGGSHLDKPYPREGDLVIAVSNRRRPGSINRLARARVRLGRFDRHDCSVRADACH